MLELPLVLVGDRPEALASLLPLDEDARRVVLERALGAEDAVVARVRARVRDVVLHHDRATLRRLDDRRVEIAGDVALAPARVGLVVLERLLAVEREPALGGGD